jgi:hypothetical protein
VRIREEERRSKETTDLLDAFDILLDAMAQIRPPPPQTPQFVSRQKYRPLQFFVGYFGLDSVLLTEGNILDPCYVLSLGF